jgi:DNA replication and repair protein RecF
VILTDLHIFQFRNIQSFDWKPHERANLLVGMNAQGKTNLLESIFLLGTTKSLRHGQPSDDLIMEGKSEAFSKGVIKRETPDLDRDLEVLLRKGEPKLVRLNGKKLTPFSKIFGQLTVVLFVPEDLQMVKAGPAARRYYLDLEISQASQPYLHDLQIFQRVLKQRNGALRLLAEGQAGYETVEAFDEPLIQSGSAIVQFRRQAVAELEPLAAEVQRRVSRDGEALSLQYASSLVPADRPLPAELGEIQHCYRLKLKEVMREEKMRCTTLAGPHRDDLEILLNARPARAFASQGQQRTTALALKLAEVQFLSRRLNENPILLLDDVLSELDLTRQQELLGLLDEHVQTFVTSTHADGLAYKPGQVLTVEKGKISRNH